MIGRMDAYEELLLVALLLTTLFMLSGCVSVINQSRYASITYDAEEKLLTVPLHFYFFDSFGGKDIGYNTTENKFTSEDTTPVGINALNVYYAVNDDGIEKLKADDFTTNVEDKNIKKLTLDQLVITDRKSKKQIPVGVGMTLPEYNAKGGSLEYEFDEIVHQGYVDILLGIPGVELAAGQKAALRVYIQTQYVLFEDYCDSLSKPIEYQYAMPKPVSAEAAQNMPVTGDVSNLPLFISLLCMALIALCVHSGKKTNA